MGVGRAEVDQWAIRRGFDRVGPNIFDARHDDFIVRLRLGRERMWTSALRRSGQDILLNTRYSRLQIDIDDMLHGAGLNSEFIDRMYRGADAPVWFPPRYFYRVLDEVSRSASRSPL
jgi:hypothetical protein